MKLGMGLRAKFNLVLFGVFSLAVVSIGYLSYRMLADHARREVIERAELMMQAALAVRHYTVSEVRPLLQAQMAQTFLPQTVPAYAATQAFLKLKESHPQYNYKEATLDPTNPRDRADEWEVKIIDAFRSGAASKEIVGMRNTENGQSFYIASPIKIKDAACLTCHSTIDKAPSTMLVKYGDQNGFGWKMNDIVGAQIVSVPMTLAVHQARTAFFTFMGSLVTVLVVTIFLLNVMLSRIVIKPIVRMAYTVNEVSSGEQDVPELPEDSSDEVGVLAASFNRMRRSLDRAMKILGS